jgi:hypothetical protein
MNGYKLCIIDVCTGLRVWTIGLWDSVGVRLENNRRFVVYLRSFIWRMSFSW